jgi:hypothetical protein
LVDPCLFARFYGGFYVDETGGPSDSAGCASRRGGMLARLRVAVADGVEFVAAVDE